MANNEAAEKMRKQREALAALTERVPEALRDCIASQIIGMIDGAALAVALQQQAS